MKRLIVNNIEVILDKDLKIPYSVKNFDIENPTLINIDKSKTISLKRCNVNDEAFGYLANNSRLNTSVDSGNGIKFNPIKLNTYQLLEDSELLSEGIVSVTEINATEINIELFDNLLKKLNELDDKFINDIDLFDDLPINWQNLNVLNGQGIIPVYGLDDTSLDKNKLFCTIANNNEYILGVVDLPQECSPIHIRSFKSYDARLAVGIDKIIDKINEKYGDIVELDENIDGLTDLKILSNKFTEKDFSNKFTVTGTTGSYQMVTNTAATGTILDKNLIVNFGSNEVSASDIRVKSTVYLGMKNNVANTVRQWKHDVSAKTVAQFNAATSEIDKYVGALKGTFTLQFFNGSTLVDEKTTEAELPMSWNKNFYFSDKSFTTIFEIDNTFEKSVVNFNNIK